MYNLHIYPIFKSFQQEISIPCYIAKKYKIWQNCLSEKAPVFFVIILYSSDKQFC